MPPDQETSAWKDFYSTDVALETELGNLLGHAPLLQAVLDSGPRRVLEVGVGTGAMSRFLGVRGFEVVGLDNEGSIVERASVAAQAVPCVSYALGDAFKLRELFGPSQFDVAFSQGFFEHFDDDDVRELVRQQLAVSRGVLFSVPSDKYGHRDLGNERLLSPARWTGILDGFGAVHAEYYGEASLGWHGRLKGILPPRYLHVLVSVSEKGTER